MKTKRLFCHRCQQSTPHAHVTGRDWRCTRCGRTDRRQVRSTLRGQEQP